MIKSWTPAFRQVMKRDEQRQDKDAVEMIDYFVVKANMNRRLRRTGGLA